MKKINLLVVLALAATPAFLHAQTTSYSDVVGYNKISAPIGSSFQSFNFVNEDLFQGVVGSVSGNTITLTGLSGVASNAWAPTDGLPDGEPVNIPQYYMEVTSGPLAGYNFDIVSNSGSQVTIDSAPAGLVGQGAVIRRHVSLGQIASTASGLTSNVDSATIFNPDGTQLDVSWDGANWVDLNNFVYGDAYVIYPGVGFALNSAGVVNLNQSGLVKKTPTVVSVFNGAVNIVSTMNPQVGVAITLGAANFGEFLVKNADTLSTFSTVAQQLQVEYDTLLS